MLELQQIYESLIDPKQIEIVAAILPILQNYEDRITKLEKGKEEIEITWIDEFINLFPAVRGGGGKPLRSNRLDCQTKMKKFIKLYKYPKDVILAATKSYINNQDEEFKYTKTSSYFIDKMGQGSALADCCQEYVNNKKTETNKTQIIRNDFI